ncbi:MAG: hypothetical protein ACK58L_08395, partial [Planctomycetota bacterium]
MRFTHTLTASLLSLGCICSISLPLHGADPEHLNETRVAELEERLFRLESTMFPEGCRGAADEWDSCSTVGPSVFAGYKFLFVQPQMKESFEATLLNTATGQTTLVPLDNEFELTPN